MIPLLVPFSSAGFPSSHQGYFLALLPWMWADICCFQFLIKQRIIKPAAGRKKKKKKCFLQESLSTKCFHVIIWSRVILGALSVYCEWAKPAWKPLHIQVLNAAQWETSPWNVLLSNYGIEWCCESNQGIWHDREPMCEPRPLVRALNRRGPSNEHDGKLSCLFISNDFVLKDCAAWVWLHIHLI